MKGTQPGGDGSARFRVFRDHRGRQAEMPLWLLASILVLVVLLVFAMWTSRRRLGSDVALGRLAPLPGSLPSMAGASLGMTAFQGGEVEVLQNGNGFFPRLLADIAAARDSVHLETYVWWRGEVCRRVAEALAARAREGLEVRLLLDASGSSRMDEELLAMMRQAGVRAVKFHPFELALIGRVNNRDHRKIAVLDGRVGYLFGHGFAREWEGDAEDSDHWRDTAVRVEGPVVQGIQSVFAENWVEATGEAFVGEGVYPALGPAGEMVTHLAWSSPTGTVSAVELLHFLAIAAARRELLIQNPYLIPDQDLRAALAEAVRRGVEVDIMVPGEVIDSQLVRHAAHWRYAPLLASGVHICEYRKTLNHQKVMVVDRIWSLVGSTNFDSRSFEINDEVSMGILDAGIAAELAAAFERDGADCEEIELETWQGRSLWHKAIDKLAHLVHEQL